MKLGRIPRVYPRAFSGVFVALVYVAFGLMDMVLSLAAFSLGISEGNPFLAWVEGCGLFLPTKVFLTAVAGILIGLLYPHARTRPLTHCALGIMAFVNAYHVWALNVLLPAG